jgi:hypothetical protein
MQEPARTHAPTHLGEQVQAGSYLLRAAAFGLLWDGSGAGVTLALAGVTLVGVTLALPLGALLSSDAQLHGPYKMYSRWHRTDVMPAGVSIWSECAIGVRSHMVNCALHVVPLP